MFSIGVCLVVIVQTYVATIFARYLSNHLDVIDILQRVALVIFVLITVYYLVFAAKQIRPEEDENIKSKHSRLFFGMFLSCLNVFPIPYQAYMTITLAAFGWLTFDFTSVAAYVAGSAMGTFVMLYVYIFFFDKIKGRPITSQKNMNYIIGGITGIISIVTLINVVKEF